MHAYAPARSRARQHAPARAVIVLSLVAGGGGGYAQRYPLTLYTTMLSLEQLIGHLLVTPDVRQRLRTYASTAD